MRASEYLSTHCEWFLRREEIHLKGATHGSRTQPCLKRGPHHSSSPSPSSDNNSGEQEVRHTSKKSRLSCSSSLELFQPIICSLGEEPLKEVSFFTWRGGAPENWGRIRYYTFSWIKRGDQKIFKLKRGINCFLKEAKYFVKHFRFQRK